MYLLEKQSDRHKEEYFIYYLLVMNKWRIRSSTELHFYSCSIAAIMSQDDIRRQSEVFILLQKYSAPGGEASVHNTD